MNVITCSHVEEAKQKAIAALNTFLTAQKDTPVLFMTSGGSALSLVEGIDSSSLSDNLTLTVLDERYSTTPEENNFALLTRTSFFEHAIENGVSLIDTRVQQGESLQQLSSRFDYALKDWRRRNPQGHIVATMGMGPDGHISGIMPHPESEEVFSIRFEQPEHWVCGYDAEGKNPFRYRATTTIPFIREQIDYAVAYIVGLDKKESFARAMQSQKGRHAVPARTFHEMKAVDIFTDITL